MDQITSFEEVEAESRSAIVGSVAGAAALALTIVGLAGVESEYMLGIAAVVIGVMLLAQGGLMAAELKELSLERSNAALTSAIRAEGALGAQTLAGSAGIILGVLSIIGVAPLILGAIATIALGVGFVASSGAHARVNLANAALLPERTSSAELARGAAEVSAGELTLVGLGAAILGVIAVAGADTLDLALVSLLILGSSALVSGGGLSSWMASIMATGKAHG